MFCCNNRALRMAAASLIALLGLFSLTAAAQQSPPGASPLTAAQIDQLVAPIALYPDPLVAQILMAATYPLEIVEADRWLRQPANAALTGDTLAAALEQQPWDPSVKSLVALRQLLHLMDAELDWTERLGDAFLAQPSDVMDAIQRLRRRAQAAGALITTPQQTVSTEDQEIMIEPASSEIVYVPAYNPWCIYGSWPYSDAPPFYFGTWSGSCTPADSFIDFDNGIYPPFGFWAWGRFDWRHHRIRIDRERFERFHSGNAPPGGIWQHDPIHRHGVPYRDPQTAARFQGAATPEARVIRGFGPATAPVAAPAVPQARPSIPSAGRAPAAGPPSRHPGPPAYESFGRGVDVRGEAARGFSSRMAPASPPPSFHAAPAPSFHGGGGFGGRR